MTQNRSSSKHRRRRTAGLLLSVAALAIGFSVGPGGYRHLDSGSPRIEMALGGGGGGAGGAGGGFGHWRAKSGAAGSQNGTTGGQNRAYGPGEGDTRSDWGGYMPNGEDGLMALADFVHGHDGGNNPNQGTQHGWDGKPGPGGDPDDPSTEVGSGGPKDGGFTSGGGYTGGGGGGGGFGGGGGGPGGNGGNGGGGPGTTGPGGPTFPGDPGDGGAGCIVNCGKPDDGGWRPNEPDGPGEGGPGGDAPLTSAVPEPAVWMMLILGFGVLGSALRVQRRKRPQILA